MVSEGDLSMVGIVAGKCTGLDSLLGHFRSVLVKYSHKYYIELECCAYQEVLLVKLSKWLVSRVHATV